VIEKNSIHHYLNTDGIRLTVVDVTDAVNFAMDVHHLNQMATAILGEVMAGTAILATDFKNHEGVSVRWNTNGPLGVIHTDTYEGSYVRGYIDHPEKMEDTSYTEEGISSWINQGGQLFVTRYSLLKMPFTSTVNLDGKDVSTCFTNYIIESDQTMTRIETAISFTPEGRVERAMAYMAQLLPQGDREEFLKLFSRKTSYAFWKSEGDSRTLMEDMIRDNKFSLLGESTMEFRCTCSEDRIRSALMSLPVADREEMLKDPNIEVTCQCCGKVYHIPSEAAKKWFNDANVKGDQVQ
jgi:molecular chaperone Hsp33